MPSDKFAVRLVVLVFAVLAIGSFTAMVALALMHRAQVENFNRAFIGSTGVLAGVLARTTTTEPHAEPVVEAPTVVVQPED